MVAASLSVDSLTDGVVLWCSDPVVSSARPSALRDPGRTVRVVVADDDVEVRTLVGFILSQDPAVLLVGEPDDGESAIILVREAQPDLVVMDVWT